MEIGSLFFWRAVFAEFLATLLFVFINCGVTITWKAAPSITQIALCFGFSIAVLVQIFGPSSGANINPAVSIGLWVGRRISFLRLIFYIVFQCAGGVTGAVICYAITPSLKRGSLGAVSLGDGVTRYQGFAMEGILTCVLVLTVLASTDEKRSDETFGPALAIGLSVTVCHLIGIPYTGCGINPARALGPAVIMELWPEYHWVYWAGPVAGAVFAGVTYKFIFEPVDKNSSLDIITSDFIMENNIRSFDNSKGMNSELATTGI